MSKYGVRCLRCNTDLWASPILQSCHCGNVNVAIENGIPVIGKIKGTPYQVLREENGKIVVTDSINTERDPRGETKIDTTKANPPTKIDLD